jgi:hypothetical protein
MTDTFSGNAFEHWERDVLTGQERYSFMATLRNFHFKSATDAEFQQALQAWADAHGVTMRSGHALTARRDSEPCIYFTLPGSSENPASG